MTSIEPGADLRTAVWRKSSRSDAGGNCVEVASVDAVIAARDSKDPYGPKLAFTPSQWSAFAQHLKRSLHI